MFSRFSGRCSLAKSEALKRVCEHEFANLSRKVAAVQSVSQKAFGTTGIAFRHVPFGCALMYLVPWPPLVSAVLPVLPFVSLVCSELTKALIDVVDVTDCNLPPVSRSLVA